MTLSILSFRTRHCKCLWKKNKQNLWAHSTTLKYLCTSPRSLQHLFRYSTFIAKHQLTECDINPRKMPDHFLLVSLANSHRMPKLSPLLSSPLGLMVPSFGSQAERGTPILNAGYEEGSHQNDSSDNVCNAHSSNKPEPHQEQDKERDNASD